jgi:SAM-dependent methyltransferase
MSGYEAEYFAPRAADLRREEMGRQEHARLIARTGLQAGAVVDVGCGMGEFLDRFDDAAWDRFGVDVSELAVEACRAKGIAFDLPDGDGWADLVVLRGSLQHLDRPIQALADAHRWLRPGGWLAILATPNAGGPVYRLFQELPALDPPRNFVVFSDRELAQCLRNLGFAAPGFVYPYLGTPYASPLRDHLRFAARLAGRHVPFAFWRNMMECYAQR